MNKFIFTLLLFCPFIVFGQGLSQIQFFGTLKAGYEVDTEDGYARFIVNNARLGAKGDINKHIGFFMQTDFNAAGKIVMLDAYARLMPIKKLDIWLGQLQVPFSETYVNTPGHMMFASMTYLYPDASGQARDIGMRVNYKTSIKNVPTELQAGVFDGSDINKPSWEKRPTVSGRLLFGEMKGGFRASVKYFACLKKDKEVNSYGFDLRYATEHWKIEAEWNQLDSLATDNKIGSYFIQGGYRFDMKDPEGFVKYVMPVGRVESIGQDIFNNGFSHDRFTLGVNFGIDVRPMKGEIRLNYDKCFRKSNITEGRSADMFALRSDPRAYQDKFIVSLLLNF